MRRSPWLQDEKIGPEFQKTSQKIYELLSAADAAMKAKAKGNKAFGDNKYEEALQAWCTGRKALEEQSLTGHHMAVLWSNEAMCRKKMNDIDGCRKACQAGLANTCAKSIRTKLQHNLAACSAEPDKKEAGPAETQGGTDKGKKASSPAEAEGGTDKDKKVPAQTEAAAGKSEQSASEDPKPTKNAKKGTALKGGFLKEIGESAKPMYGPKGSVQGKNHSDMCLAPVQGQMHPVPYGKILPVSVPNPYLEQEEEDSD